MNKKSQIFVVGMVLLGMAGLIYAYIALTGASTDKNLENMRLGTYQKAIVDAYQKAESALLYIDLAAKYSFDNAVQKSAENGAVYSNIEQGVKSKCGSYGYKLLNDEKNECYEDYKTGFGKYLVDNVNEKSSKIEGMVLENDYDFVLNGNYLSAIAKYDVSINVVNAELENKVIGNELGKEIKLGDMVPIPKEVHCAGNCILRQEAAEKLLEAQRIASSMGYNLDVYSSYRTPERQKELWEQSGENSKMVCGPGTDSFNHCPHVFGGAVDIRLLNVQMTEGNRTILQNIMCKAGWVRYKAEWWHFEYGTSRWKKGTDANVCAT